jgi:predicted metal-dependent peptidase
MQRKAPFKRVKLTSQERRYWEDTLAALSWIAPGFIHILYTMLANSGDDDVALFTHDIDATAATDGYQLIFNPQKFFKYPLMERCFAVLHEIMHEILNHVQVGYHFKVKGTMTMDGKTVPYDHMFANIMQDFVINAILIASKMGKFNPDWLWNTDVATEHDQWMHVYFKHWRDRPKIKINLSCNSPGQGQGKPGDKGKGKGKADDLRDPRKPQAGAPDPNAEGDGPPSPDSPHQFDVHLDPHQSKGEDPADVPDRNEAQWEMAIKAGMEIQIAQGKMPAALKMFFDEVLRPKVDWTDHIRGILLRIAGSGAYDWRKLDRRLITRGIGSPGQTGHGAGVIVVGGDTSMSVFHNQRLVMRWIGEVGGMVEDVQPEETHVVWCDTEVKRVDVCTDAHDVRKMVYDGIPGGGGTKFYPVFKYIEDNDLRPDALIYLTDGEGEFPKREPDYPVIWGDISHGKVKYPWGSVVDIPTASDTDD